MPIEFCLIRRCSQTTLLATVTPLSDTLRIFNHTYCKFFTSI